MPAGVRVPHRVVAYVRVPVQVLRVPRLRYDGVRLDEAAEGRVVPPRVVVVQPDDPVPPLAREAVGLYGPRDSGTLRGPGCRVECCKKSAISRSITSNTRFKSSRVM